MFYMEESEIKIRASYIECDECHVVVEIPAGESVLGQVGGFHFENGKVVCGNCKDSS